jgi:hypothetical protein
MKGDFDECGRNAGGVIHDFNSSFTPLFFNCVSYIASKSVVIVKYELETRVKTWQWAVLRYYHGIFQVGQKINKEIDKTCHVSRFRGPL